MHLGYPGKLHLCYSLDTGEVLGWGTLFNYRHSLKRDSAESCQLLRFSVTEKRNAWISKWEDYRQHFTEPIAVHPLHWLDHFFGGERHKNHGRSSSKILVDLFPRYNMRPVSMMNYSPYHCHQYWLCFFSIIYFR